MRLGIRYQLLFPLLSLMLFAAGMTAWMAWLAADRARGQIEKQMDAIADTVQKATFPINVRILQLMKGMSGAEFLITDSSRKPLHDESGQPVSTLSYPPDHLPEPATEWQQAKLGPRVQVKNEEFFCLGVHLHANPATYRVIYIFYPVSLWQDALWQAVRPALFVGGIGGVVSILFSLTLTQRWTRRIQELERRTRRIAEGDFSPTTLRPATDELGDLAQSVNEMAQRLARFEESMRRTERLRLLGQVSGGLAHQLRNGVAGAKLALQLAGRERRESEELSVALRQLTLMEMQLHRFLDLGKAMNLQREPSDLGQQVAEAVALLMPRCQHARIQLAVHRPDQPIRVLIDPVQFGQVLINLLTNAIEAVGTGGVVDVYLHQQGDRAVVEILDTGPGPSAEIAGRLFEPFATGKPEGVGLGLAVAKQVTEAHAGTLTWMRKGDRTVFRIELPRLTNEDTPAS